jgi:DNA-binding protein YbaB
MENLEKKQQASNLNWYLTRTNSEISLLINDYFNAESDEEKNEMLEKFNSLQLSKNELVEGCIYSYKHLENAIDNADKVIKQANEYKQSMQKLQDTLKSTLVNSIDVGEKFVTPEYKVGWRKSTSVDIDNSLIAEDVYCDFPDLVDCKVSYSFKKTEIKKAIEGNEIVPVGMKLKVNQNIQIR